MNRLNKSNLILILILSLNFKSSALISEILKDIGKTIIILEQANRFNRKLVSDGVKNLLGFKKDSQDQDNQNNNNDLDFFDPKPKRNFPDIWGLDEKNQNNNNNSNFTFKDLAGKIPEDIREIVDFLNRPERFRRVGAHIPKGVLLVGPPGTGKTSIARAIAGEANAAFFDASASSFIEVYVGVGPSRIRELFQQARDAIKAGPKKKAIIFIDELDAIGNSRNGRTNSEYRNTLNELLNQMDGFKQDDAILVIGATNTPDSIDPALKRPGRFDRIVEIGLPDEESRLAILKLYSQKIRCHSEVNLSKLVNQTRNWSAADLKNLVNEAAVRAARANATQVTEQHFDDALQHILNIKRRLG